MQTEWAYNYHDAEAPWRCNTKNYPTLEEQHRFIRAYLMHNSSYKATGGYTSNPPTPHLGPLPSSGSTTALAATAAPSSISAFMLDSRAPPGEKYQEQEAQYERQIEEETRRLLAETKLWRLANSAMWVAWGIVQAHIPSLPDFDAEAERTKAAGNANPSPEAALLNSATAELEAAAKAAQQDDAANGTVSQEMAEQQSQAQAQMDQEEFDYLQYAHDRAMFVWGDALRMGIVSPSDLPEELLQSVKLVEY